MENTIKVIDIYTNEECEVLADEATLYSFNNKDKVITMTAPKVNSNFGCTYNIHGTIDDVAQKIETWNNPVKAVYADIINYDWTKNDPDRKILKKIIEMVENNQEKYFTKTGDWRQRIQANVKEQYLELVSNN